MQNKIDKIMDLKGSLMAENNYACIIIDIVNFTSLEYQMFQPLYSGLSVNY